MLPAPEYGDFEELPLLYLQHQSSMIAPLAVAEAHNMKASRHAQMGMG
jgi:hypothetical protein